MSQSIPQLRITVFQNWERKRLQLPSAASCLFLRHNVLYENLQRYVMYIKKKDLLTNLRWGTVNNSSSSWQTGLITIRNASIRWTAIRMLATTTILVRVNDAIMLDCTLSPYTKYPPKDIGRYRVSITKKWQQRLPTAYQNHIEWTHSFWINENTKMRNIFLVAAIVTVGTIFNYKSCL